MNNTLLGELKILNFSQRKLTSGHTKDIDLRNVDREVDSVTCQNDTLFSVCGPLAVHVPMGYTSAPIGYI